MSEAFNEKTLLQIAREIGNNYHDYIDYPNIQNKIISGCLWAKKLQQNPILKDLKRRNFKEGEI